MPSLTKEKSKHEKLLDEEDKFGITKLIHACMQGDKREISRLIKDGAIVDETCDDGRTALMFASSSAYWRKTLRILLEAGADPNKRDKNGLTPIMHAAKSYTLNSISVLQEYGARIDDRDNDGKTALIRAVDRKKPGSNYNIRKLLSLGADVNIEDNSGKNAVSYAKDKNDNVLESLLKEGDGLCCLEKSETEITPLLTAYNANNMEDFESLLEFGGDVFYYEKVKVFNTIVTFPRLISQNIIEDCNQEAWDILVKHGFSIDRLEQMAKEKNIPGPLLNVFLKNGLLFEEDEAEFLINNGADINALDSSGKSLIYHTSHTEFPINKINFLLEHGAKVTDNMFEDMTDLHLPLFPCKGNVEVINFLINHGFDPKKDSNKRYGIVERLCRKFCEKKRYPGESSSEKDCFFLKILDILTKNGADINAKNKDGGDAVSYAIGEKNTFVWSALTARQEE